ncbi:hypothetical protein TRFO_37921 [Tritrichomonas foetus]|uniref:Uncharacterized protein n=1 Tax=Tritrichomonas foetus TaxID=1144522 RepID=A0A1J4J9T3_9EUKA|nr:hypothetical protein TRFO_37921 [Tritrichomonas foetus]|eukprot:OHS95950.1 hypothetical protein TRFO_37921 [Tritrichomonas foetus]
MDLSHYKNNTITNDMTTFGIHYTNLNFQESNGHFQIRELISQISSSLQSNEINVLLQQIHKELEHIDDCSILEFVENEKLFLLLQLVISNDNINIFYILSFFLNIVFCQSPKFNDFFTSSYFWEFIIQTLNISDSDVLEYSLLILYNLIATNDRVREFLLNLEVITAISSLQNDHLLIMERKVELFYLILQNEIHNERIKKIILHELFNSLIQSKFDSIKCYSIKGFTCLLDREGAKFVDSFSTNENFHLFLSKMIQTLEMSQSKRLSRLILIFLIKLMNSFADWNSLITLFLNNNFLSIIYSILNTNEDKCAALCFDIFQFILDKQKDFVLDFSFIFNFGQKGFIVKKKIIEFLLFLCTIEKTDVFENFSDNLCEFFNEILDSNDVSILSCISEIYNYLDNTYFGEKLLIILHENETFYSFVRNENTSIMKEQLLLIESRFLQHENNK